MDVQNRVAPFLLFGEHDLVAQSLKQFAQMLRNFFVSVHLPDFLDFVFGCIKSSANEDTFGFAGIIGIAFLVSISKLFIPLEVDILAAVLVAGEIGNKVFEGAFIANISNFATGYN